MCSKHDIVSFCVANKHDLLGLPLENNHDMADFSAETLAQHSVFAFGKSGMTWLTCRDRFGVIMVYGVVGLTVA